MRAISRVVNGRREATYLALAAAEISWAAPVFLALSWDTHGRLPYQVWLGMAGLLLGYFYIYRVVMRTAFSLRAQQSMLVVVLLVSIGLMLRYHLYADAGLVGIAWVLEPFRRLADLSASPTGELLTIFPLLYLWARGIHLARRSLSVESVGFSFRAGVVIFVWCALALALFGNGNAAGFVAPFFFFGLVAVALARVEEVSRMPGSSRAPGGGVWISSAVVAVALVVLLSSLVALFFSGGALAQVLRLFSPVVVVLEWIILGLALLIFGALELLLSVLPLNLARLQSFLQEAMRGFGLNLQPIPGPEETAVPESLGTVQAGVILATIVFVIALVLLFTWWRVYRERYGQVDESRESLLSANLLAQGLRNMLRAGRDRLSQMAGLVDRFGLGSRLLSAISIQRIYANLVRLATRAGYPRVKAQTPYEYLVVLCEAWPDSQGDLCVITDAYVNAHYGQVPDSREELARIRACWERVRASKD
jgi:hypothetical protein